MRYVVSGVIASILFALWFVAHDDEPVAPQVVSTPASKTGQALPVPGAMNAQGDAVQAKKKQLVDFAPDQRSKAAIAVFQKGYPATKEEMVSVRENYKVIMQARIAQAKAEHEERLAKQKRDTEESLKNPFLEK